MNTLDIIKSFLGLRDKEISARTDEALKIGDQKHKKIMDQIKRLKHQATKVHKHSKQTNLESVKLIVMVKDVTTAISVATGQRIQQR